jgi:hypothetical protein
MIAIDNVLISDAVVEEQFVCDLTKCKGGCCEDGDAGAPLLKEELKYLTNYYDVLLPYMTPEGIREVERQGKYTYDTEFGFVTPTINGQICAYGYRDSKNVIKCSVEQAYNDGKIPWKKPISCHLFPIRMSHSEIDPEMEYLNYEPREDLCKAACNLGKQLKVPAYVFLKESIIRQYGEEFYQTLDETAKHMKQNG